MQPSRLAEVPSEVATPETEVEAALVAWLVLADDAAVPVAVLDEPPQAASPSVPAIMTAAAACLT
jgi:hypothetical protein